mmetsp:Transcript_11795/g.25168  ORF Transcript_11795/g.25168 Transcript_11795/m.25168 type:complete len:1106 (+) Transcript_11795:14-3331(+)
MVGMTGELEIRDSDYCRDFLVGWVLERVEAAGFDVRLWTESHSDAVIEWLKQASDDVFFVWEDCEPKKLNAANCLPSDSARSSKLVYFIFLCSEVSKASRYVVESICYGTVNLEMGASSLERQFASIFSTCILGSSSSWSRETKKSLLHFYYGCMANLTINPSSHGKNELLLPTLQDLNEIENRSLGSSEKDLISRIENIALSWVSRIDQLLRNLPRKFDTTIIEELEHWKSHEGSQNDVLAQLSGEPIQNILQMLKIESPMCANEINFRKQLLQDALKATSDNIENLDIISLACQTLVKMKTPLEIDACMTEILEKIKLVTSRSSYYGSKEGFARLLLAISWTVIKVLRRLCPWASLRGGKTEASIAMLRDAIEGGSIFMRSIDSANQRPVDDINEEENAKFDGERQELSRFWDLDIRDMIFAPIHSYIQRCQDFLAIYNGLKQFSIANLFNGLRGRQYEYLAETISIIGNELFAEFSRLTTVEYDPFDVTSSGSFGADCDDFKKTLQKHDDRFKDAVNNAFRMTPRINEATNLLDVLYRLVSRDTMSHYLQKKAVLIQVEFESQCDHVREEFEMNRRCPPLSMDEPTLSGRAVWAKSLLSRLDYEYTIITNSDAMKAYAGSDAGSESFKSLQSAISVYHEAQNQEWLRSLGSIETDAILDQPLLHIEQDGFTTLFVCAFPTGVAIVLREAPYWEKHSSEDLPNKILSLIQRQEDLRVMNERTINMVRMHSELVYSLNDDPSHLRLFAGYLKGIEKLMRPGNRSLMWSSRPSMVEKYVGSVLPELKKAQEKYKEFRTRLLQISKVLKMVEKEVFLSIDKNVTYNEKSFRKSQEKCIGGARDRVSLFYQSIENEVKVILDLFTDSPKDVHAELELLVTTIDSGLERVVRQSVRHSLLCLYQAMNMKKAGFDEQMAIFEGLVQLVDDKVVQFRPSLIEMTDAVNEIAKSVVQNSKDFTKLTHSFNSRFQWRQEQDNTTKNGKKLCIVPDEKVDKIIQKITDSMSSASVSVEKVLNYWDKYSSLWTDDKDAYARGADANKIDSSQLQHDIKQFEEKLSALEMEKTFHCVYFIRLDLEPLRENLICHCKEWIALLSKIIKDQDSSLHR